MISILFYLVYHFNDFAETLNIPFTNIEVDLGWFFVIFILFWLVGFSNAVNLTDGLDGLVSGLSVIAFSAFGVIAFYQEQWMSRFSVLRLWAECLDFYYLIKIQRKSSWEIPVRLHSVEVSQQFLF